MSQIKLLPHNEEAYERLINCLEFNQMAAINHATGTGKSFIVLKYLYENRNKKILYLAPTYQIIDQLIEKHTKELEIDVKDFNKFDTFIYANLLNKDMQNLAQEYDIVILDEYHRCGAPKWGKKVNELLDILKNNYPDKKVVGTTATEIRFLDNEKNMNNILFDGVCASKLTLVDAMLKGILPVPVYINAIYELYSTLDNIENKIINKCFYKTNINKYLNTITTLRQELEKSMSNLNIIDKDFEQNGKYLVFSSSVLNIEKDKQTINKLFKNKVDNSFEVYCKKTKKRNKKELEEFININKGNNFLYSVNLLNEGLHVKDINAIFMFRKTTSPIIYFQQLGRLLSYSKRKDTVYVFDLVNNIKNHPYIYYLYQEVYRRGKELIDLEPEKKEFYQDIMNNFKIIDLTSNSCEKINKLIEAVKTGNLKKERLNTAVLILEGKLNCTPAEKVQAQIDIFKLKKFIDLDLFNRIKSLNIKKPKIFVLEENQYKLYLTNEKFKIKFDRENKDDNLTHIHNEIIFRKKFEEVLNEVETEFEKYENKEEYFKKIYFDILKFIKENYRIPKYSKDQETDVYDELTLFFKKIIFYNDLEKRGYIDKLNEYEIEMNKKYILKEYSDFSLTHNGDLPSLKVKSKKEYNLIKKLKQIEPLFEQSELNIINGLRKKQLIRMKEVIKEYINFIKINKRYPLEDSKDEKERELFNSYLRCEEFLTKEEKALIKSTILSINKKSVLQNTYIEMLKNRR